MTITARSENRPTPPFPTYERLQQGEGEVALQAILDENPLLGLTVVQEIDLGSVTITGLDIDPATGKLADLRVRLRGRRPAGSVKTLRSAGS